MSVQEPYSPPSLDSTSVCLSSSANYVDVVVICTFSGVASCKVTEKTLMSNSFQCVLVMLLCLGKFFIMWEDPEVEVHVLPEGTLLR